MIYTNQDGSTTAIGTAAHYDDTNTAAIFIAFAYASTAATVPAGAELVAMVKPQALPRSGP